MNYNADYKDVNRLDKNLGYTIKSYKLELIVFKPIKFEYYPGFVWHNALLGAMKEIYCKNLVNGKAAPLSCEQCQYHSGCIYHILNFPFRNQETTYPQPYLIDASECNQGVLYPIRSRIVLGITLFGTANNHFIQFLDAVRYIGESSGIGVNSGRFRILSFVVENPVNYILPDKNVYMIRLDFYAIHLLRYSIVEKGLNFGMFLELLQKRINNLSRLYLFDEPASIISTKEISVNDCQFNDSRLLYPPKGHLKYYCCSKGFVVFHGELDNYIDLLITGSKIGIGQYTTAGLGTYHISYE